MTRLAFLLLPLLISTAAHGNLKIIKLGSLTVECFFPECEEKLKQIDGFIVENDIQGLGHIVTIAFSNWWSKPTVEGRVIINMYDQPEIIISYLERHGSAARTAFLDAQDVAKEIRQKYGVEISCERRTVAIRCAEVIKQIQEVLNLATAQGNKPVPQTMEIVAVDWSVDKSKPKAAIFGTLKSDSRRYHIKEIMTLQDIELGFKTHRIYFDN